MGFHSFSVKLSFQRITDLVSEYETVLFVITLYTQSCSVSTKQIIMQVFLRNIYTGICVCMQLIVNHYQQSAILFITTYLAVNHESQNIQSYLYCSFHDRPWCLRQLGYISFTVSAVCESHLGLSQRRPFYFSLHTTSDNTSVILHCSFIG